MEKLQVLLATMGRKDFSIADTMNISCSAVIANQADHESIETKDALKMITTKTRGVGLNRNIGLMAATSELVLFADDDVVYYDGMPEAVVSAFRENPDADVLIFGMDIVKNGVITEKRHLKRKRRHLWNSLRFGTYTIAARREALLQHHITFHQCFGGGCIYGSGEDSLFLKDCFDHKLRVYSHEYVLGTCCKDASSWFTGHNEKYFYDKGALMRYLFPNNPWLMALYFGIRFKRESPLGPVQRVKWMFAGVRGGRKLIPYKEIA